MGLQVVGLMEFQDLWDFRVVDWIHLRVPDPPAIVIQILTGHLSMERWFRVTLPLRSPYSRMIRKMDNVTRWDMLYTCWVEQT